MPYYDWRYCPVCGSETHHTITDDRIICNACHTEEEIEVLLKPDKYQNIGGTDHALS